MLRVIEAGLYSTIQDAGRHGFGHLGVRYAGAADDLALAAANLLVGSGADAAGIEMTLLGGTFAVEADMTVAITGADMEARVPEERQTLAVGQSHALRAGTTLAFSGATDGARTYLALPGGVAAQEALGSASTDPVAGFGGLDGRALQPGDVLEPRAESPSPVRCWSADVPSSGVALADGPRRLAVVAGPHHSALPGVDAALVGPTWTVTPRSDRVGLRLEGVPIADADAPDLASLPMLPGAVQLPPNGLPIMLMPDAPTVGGYPVPAVIADADRHVTGRLRPGDELVFEWIELDEARRRSRERAEALAAVAAELE
jgi:antagonist of KipI